jgi:Ca2+-binding EF-hand superfamily protein
MKTDKNMSEDDLSMSQEVFKHFDSVGDGKIDCLQVGDVLRVLGLNPTSKYKNGERIDFQALWVFYQTLYSKENHYKAEEIIEAFRSFDRDGAGLLHSSEVKHLLSIYGEKLSDEELNEVMKDFEDDQGFIDYAKLINEILSFD